MSDDQTRAERRRREEMSERYELLSKHSRDIVLFIGQDGRLIEANEAATLAYGYPREELLKLTVRDLRAPETKNTIDEQMRAAFERGLLFETTHRRKDGTVFPVEVGSRSAMVGEDRMLLSIIRDISERKRIEAKLLQADRLVAIGTLAAGVAHEINNPLAYALANLDLITKSVTQMTKQLAPAAEDEGTLDPGELRAALAHAMREVSSLGELVRTAREGAERVAAIVRDLRAFSRPDEERRALVDVRRVLDSSITLAKSSIRHSARLVRDYEDVPIIEANEARLGQVFVNLLVNAAQSLPDRAEPAGNEIRIGTGTDEAGRAVVEVRDSGVGISSEMKARIFDPFVTSKPIGEGMGLGLFVSQAIVAGLRGEITVDSEPGRGTTIRVLLPPAVPRPAPLPDPTPRAPPVAPRTTLLIVDDEVALCEALRTALSDEFDVHIATSGAGAIEALEARLDPRLVLCDVMMPGMTGVDVYEQACKLDPSFAGRFVFMTGGALKPSALDFFLRTAAPRIDKPFELDDVLGYLRAKLASSSPRTPRR